MTSETISTPDGSFLLCFTAKGLAGIRFPASGVPEDAPERMPGGSRAPAEWTALAREAILCVLSGRQPGAIPPLDLGAGTEFQRSVWAILRRIPPGRTRSYGEVAQELGKPGATRAVGQACGANPIPLLVPCHRVLAANRRIGGFSGGREWKQKLLEREGVAIEPGSPHRRRAAESRLPLPDDGQGILSFNNCSTRRSAVGDVRSPGD